MPSKRTYEKTHPWLTFELDLRRFPPPLWILLGEARSKCEHVGGVPLRPDTAEQLNKLYLAKGARATTAIEGNTLSEEQVLERVAGTLQLPPSKEYLAKEIDNVVAAYNMIWDRVRATGASVNLTVPAIKEFNRLVLQDLALDDGTVPGQVRQHSVGVGRYRGAPPEECENLLQRLCDWLNGMVFDVSEESDVVLYAIAKAALAHLYLAWIHPFGDGNGRTARLVEFQILVGAGVPMPSAHLLSNHYNETRTEYYRELDRASASGGDIVPFVHYAVRGFVDGLRRQLLIIREQQWDVAWRSYVHERFPDSSSPSDVRRRRLVLDLSREREPVRYRQLMEVSPRVARAYAGKTIRTLARDRNALEKMELLRRTPEGYVANRNLILAFLPFRSFPPTGDAEHAE